MRRGRRLRTWVVAVAVLAGAVSLLIALTVPAGGRRRTAGSAARTANAVSCPWVTSKAPIATRVQMVVSRMSVEELDSLVHGRYSSHYAGLLPGIPRLCIPALTFEDGPDGVGDHMTGVTQLPAAVGAAATWDPSAVDAYGAVVGSEEAGKGANVNLGPTVNIVRDPRWGRAFESYGEDPYLSGRLAVADISGVQSQGVMSMVKHWDVYNQETNRNTTEDDAIVSARALHEIYMPQFQAAVDVGGAAAVMCAYSVVNGQYACQNDYLDEVLDDQFGFAGFVTSDWGGTHSTVASALAGMDVEMPNGTYFSSPLVKAVEAGQVPVAQLRQMVSRVLYEMFRFGLIGKTPTGSARASVTSPAHAAVATRVAAEGTVLLSNHGGILPLSAGSLRSIAVIGSDGTTSPVTAGGGSAAVTASAVVSPLPAIESRVGPATRVLSYSGRNPARAAAVARQARVAVVFAANAESEGSDLSSITLSGGQDSYISAVARANPNTIVVLNTGSAVTMPWLNEVKAVLEAWYPGQEDGDAITGILFGDTDPSGKLPVTFPQSLAQVPASAPAQWPGVDGHVQYSEGIDVGYRWYEAKGITPLFPFGFGLSYTTFAFSDFSVRPNAETDQATVSVRVTNSGSRAGADVVQLYVGDPAPSGEPPRQLKGFQRVYLQPGQSTTVRFDLGRQDLSYWDDATSGWVVPTGTFEVYVGDSSALANLPERGSFVVP